MKKGGYSAAASEKGLALIMVLWVLVMLSIISLNYLGSSKWETLSTRNLKDETISHYLALSGYNEALFYLMSDKDPSFDFSDGTGNFWVDKETQLITGKRMTEWGEVNINILDEDAKININAAPPDRLRKVFSSAGIKDEDMDAVVDAVLDWKDPDDEHRLSGAESDYYEGLDHPYKAKNGPFDVPEELALVKGFNHDNASGSADFRTLVPLVTTFGSGTMNINTVSTEVMQMLGLDETEIEAIMKQRNEESGGFKFVPPQFAAKGLNAVSTGTVRIIVTARTTPGSPTSRVEAVVSRQRIARGYKTQTLYWRESAENNRG